MRDYLYLWHQPRSRQLIASGIEFRDLVSGLASSGLILLRHQFDDPSLDPVSRLEYVPATSLAELAGDDIYGYGDFCWVDFTRDTALAELSDQAVAELTFFAHMARPLRGVEIPGVGNRFLCWVHDDGWYARIFYSQWGNLSAILHHLFQGILNDEQADHTLRLLHRGKEAFWCRKGDVVSCERTEDIDALQRKYLPSTRNSIKDSSRAAGNRRKSMRQRRSS